jgi:gamma-glutamylcyclotransferase (GGCT)/AIG2-like uncharacterized protein YtfP
MNLFVYGSLKRGFSNHHFLTGQIFRGLAVTRLEARMVDCGGFPGIVPNLPPPRYRIHGELWDISPECLKRIDWLEDIDAGLYTRKEWPILLEESGGIQREEMALIYLFHQNADGLTEVGPSWQIERDSVRPSLLSEYEDQQ